jgi:opacity protein-like surface antigen
MRHSTAIAIVVSALIVALAAQPARAQKWEFGAGAGGSFYKSQSVKNAATSGTAGFAPGFIATGFIGHNMYKFVAGEIHYAYGRNELELKSGSASAKFSGQSHAMYYDFLIHSAPVGAKVRPFVAVGGGVKFYQGTGTESTVQALSDLALLTKTREWKGLLTFGGGLKYQVSERLQLRVEFRDYFTPFPKKVIEPNRGSTIGDWIHNFVPMFTVTYLM